MALGMVVYYVHLYPRNASIYVGSSTIEDYAFDYSLNLYRENCQGVANWVNSGPTGVDTWISKEANPTLVIMTFTSPVQVNGYTVNFINEPKRADVYKNYKEIYGAERDSVIELALEKVKGIRQVRLTFTAEKTFWGIRTYDFICKPSDLP
jgi:hypothetical protein